MTVRVERDGRTATVILDNPARKNAITESMWTALTETFTAVSHDDSIRVVVVTGEGDAFSSGADLSADGADDVPPRHWTRRMEQINEAALALHGMPQPTIARVHGVAAGAGANLALGCDLVVASTEARFCEIFAKRGLSIDFGGSWLLPRMVGLHRAMELCLLADMVDATEAERIGLVNRVVDVDDLDTVVADFVARLDALPPIALTSIKRLVHLGSHSTLAEALAAEGVAQAVNFTTADTTEAVLAFLQKRTPEFHGR